MSFFEELKRRNVIRVGIAYVVIAWVTAQVAELALDSFNAPQWVMQTVLLLLALGLPFALFFAWVFELTPEGLRKESEIDRSQSITHKTRHKLGVVIICALVVALAYFIWESRVADRSDAPVAALQAGDTVDVTAVTQASDRRSVAVLPFANRSRLEDDVFFTDGIHDDLLTQLAKISGLKVISRTTMMQYRDTTMSIPQIADELGVATILEGGVQRAGQRIRINAQLIDVASDEHLWAETFNRGMTVDNLFEIQSEITRQIVTAIKGQLSAEEAATLDDKPTSSLAAWEAYSRSREILRTGGYNPTTYRAAEPLLRQALRLDPAFAQAQATLVEVLGLSYWIGYQQTDATRADAAALLQRLTDNAPESAETFTARSHFLYRFDRDYAGAMDALNHALAVKPGDSELLYSLGVTQRRMGLYDEALVSIRRSLEVDPGNVRNAATLLGCFRALDRWDELARYLSEARRRFPGVTSIEAGAVLYELLGNGDVEAARRLHAQMVPDSGLAYYNATTQLVWMSRDLDKVVAAWQGSGLQAYPAADPAAAGYRELDLAWVHKLRGDEQQASPLLNETLALVADAEQTSGATLAYQLTTRAIALALLGDFSTAIATAHQAMTEQPIERDHWEGPYVAAMSAHALAIAGARDEALAILDETSALPNEISRWRMYLDPRWDFFRDNERFNELARPAKLDAANSTRKPL